MNLDEATFYCGTAMGTKGRALWAFFVKLVPNYLAVCSDHADSFELDFFDQNFHLIFWLKVNNDTVSEASILEYDRYGPPPGARSFHRYLEFWKDLKISIYYVNHMLLVILRLVRTFKNVFKILIVQISCWGRTLHLTKDMNDHMVDSHFQVKGEYWHFAKKRNTTRYGLKGQGPTLTFQGTCPFGQSDPKFCLPPKKFNLPPKMLFCTLFIILEWHPYFDASSNFMRINSIEAFNLEWQSHCKGHCFASK